jgi:hypothetical protein
VSHGNERFGQRGQCNQRLLNGAQPQQVANSDVQHFPSFYESKVIELSMFPFEQPERSGDFSLDVAPLPCVVENLRIGKPIEVLRIAYEDFGHIRAGAQSSRENLDGFRRVVQIRKQLRLIERSARKSLE